MINKEQQQTQYNPTRMINKQQQQQQTQYNPARMINKEKGKYQNLRDKAGQTDPFKDQM